MTTVYVVFGDHSERISEYLSDQFKIVGFSRTLEEATVAVEKAKEKPDVFLILGSAMVTGMVDGVVNYNTVLLEYLKKMRLTCPESSIKLIISEKAGKSLIEGIVALAIYDIYKADKINVEDLPEIITTKKTIANYSDDVKLKPIQEKSKKESIEVVNREGEERAALVQRLKNITLFNNDDKNEADQSTKPPRLRTSPPRVILAMGRELNRSFQAMFSNLIEIVAEVTTAEEFKKAVTNYQPEIAVVMRSGPAGGIPEADVMAEWATSYVPEILFIAGELDETGSSMVTRAQKAGVSHILSCPPGGYISGEELVYLMQNIVRKLQETENRETTSEHRAKEKQSTVEGLETLKRNAAKLSSILRPKNKPVKKKAKLAGISMKEGVSLDEKPAEEQISSVKNPTAIVPGGLFAVVAPWRPGLAGRIAAQAVKMFAERGAVAYIAATGQSTGAVWLDVTDEELIMSDWRVPGSQAPVKKDNISIYSVDPAKNLNNTPDSELWDLVRSARKDAIYTVLDFGSDINAAHKAAFSGRSVVLVIVPGGDPVETKTSLLWLNSLREGKQNIVPGVDLRGSPPAVPEGLEPKVIIRNNPADALSMALRSNEKGEFVWNK